MSMQKMRENTKIILWVVVIAFVVTIFAVWGMDLQTGSKNNDPSVIGKVNDVPISASQYQMLYDQMARSISQNNPNKEISYAQREIMMNQAWNSIVYNILTKEQIERLKIGVTDDEIRYFLRNTPPPEIKQYFLDDKGEFNYQAYQAALNNPDIDWTNLEDLARERIPLQKLQTFLQNMVHVSNSEVRRAYEEENIELSVKYAEFPITDSDIGEYAPSPAEIDAYYKENQERYSEPERARIDFVAIDIKPTRQDVESARYKLELVQEQLQEGDDFADLANSYSEAPTASQGGNTGFISAGDRDERYIAVLDSLKTGESSGLIEAGTGFYLVKLLERRSGDGGEEEYSAQEIFMSISAGYETIDSLRALAQDVLDRAKESDLKTAAAEMNLTVVAPKPFMRNYPIEGYGFVPKLSDFAFSEKAGAFSGVIRDENHFYVARLGELIPESVKPLDEVEDAIKRELVEKKKKDTTYNRALAFYKSAAADSFEAAAAAQGVPVQTLANFHVSDNLEKFGSYSTFATAAFSVSDLAPPIECRGAYYVIKLLNRTSFDQEDFQQKMSTIGSRLYQQRVQEYVAYWYQQMEDNSTIEDYRTY